VVGADGQLPLPWLEAPLLQALSLGTSHALLLHGPEGVGQFELALVLAQAQLCEAAPPSEQLQRPCGTCASCRLFAAHTHPDAMVVLPEALRESLGWPAGGGALEEAGAASISRAKPSKEIRVDDIRAIIAFAQSSSARGRGKVVVVHPAERMNSIAANALLKTLEEPVGRTRFHLSTSAPDALLPTVRSRCHALALALPTAELSQTWLAFQAVQRPDVLLVASGGRPLEALEWVRLGVDAAAWLDLPRRVTLGQGEMFAEWSVARVVQTLQKLCHDALCVAVGTQPRYFPAASLGESRDIASLTAWAAQLRREARQSEHPWNASLKLESLVQQARRALAPSGPGENTPRQPRAFVHSAP
jgi:DNA polymerase III subunit delta'